MGSSISFAHDADSNYHCPFFTNKVGIMSLRIVANHFGNILSAVCILKIQESHEQFSNFNNSLVLLGTTPGSTTETKLHNRLWTLRLLVWEKWCVSYFSHWARLWFSKCPSKLVWAFKTFLRSKTVLHLPELPVRLGLFTIILHVPLMQTRSGHSVAYFSCASSHWRSNFPWKLTFPFTRSQALGGVAFLLSSLLPNITISQTLFSKQMENFVLTNKPSPAANGKYW